MSRAGAVVTLCVVAVLAAHAASLPAQVPADLRPLLTPRASELRLVVQRYELDRQRLDDNYAGARPDARGRQGGAPRSSPPRAPVSEARLARLRQFDLSWQRALAGLDAAALSDAGRADVSALTAAIAANLAALDDARWTLAAIDAVVPFRRDVVALVEARIRIEPMDGQRAAAALTELTRAIAATRNRIGATGTPPALAATGAEAMALLRRDLDEWFRFYDGYDPLFSWWVRLPYGPAAEALADYEAWLPRQGRPGAAAVSPASIVIPDLPATDDAPDLSELIALPQDELAGIVARFRAGDRGAADFHRRWLAALQTLDFDALSRNAQVDYLFIRRTCELAMARAGVPLPANPPRRTDASGITGDARGRAGLIRDLEDEMIPYTPEELIAIAERELDWVETELRRAAGELGFGDDWKAAIEHVKGMHPPPGGQPAAIAAMLTEAVDYLRAHDLVTVPAVAAESMHVVMLTPEEQLINPFFRGGPLISLSYPTDTMSYDQRVQSLRGNNTPFSHATAHHEMIPGHNLDLFSAARYAGSRADLGAATPFFREGWALYWELQLYARGFHDTPEERVGALFWLLHRCARILFSLEFHLGRWSPQEAVDFLVDRVGHERENATAEIRRSFGGTYSPLYQAAYLLGGIQIRAMHRELVESGRMTARAFHDEILRQGSMPIALLRLAVSDLPLRRDMDLDWRFYPALDRRN
jgi:hypothetical protein